MTAIYLVPGGTGSQNGSDWGNAFPSWAAAKSSVNDDDDIFCGGQVSGVDFDEFIDVDKGALSAGIRFHKATAAAHGDSTGWDPLYGAQRARFHGLDLLSGKLTFDGQEGGFDGSSRSSIFGTYGFQFRRPVVASNIFSPCVSIGAGLDAISLLRCSFEFDERDYYGGEANGAHDPSRVSDLSGSITSVSTGTSTVTVTTSAPHGLSSGQSVGFSQSNDNGSNGSGDAQDAGETSSINAKAPGAAQSRFPITVISPTQFTISPRAPITIAGTTGSWKLIMGGDAVIKPEGEDESRITNLTLSRFKIGNAGNSGIQAIYITGMLMEYGLIENIRGVDGVGWHQSGMSNRRVHNLTYRYNTMLEAGGSQGIGFYDDILSDDDPYRVENFLCHGSYFYNRSYGQNSQTGMVRFNPDSSSLQASGCRVNNNTFCNLQNDSEVTPIAALGDWDQEGTSVDCEANNNLVVDVEVSGAYNTSASNNQFESVGFLFGALPGANPEIDDGHIADFFADVANDDLTLQQDTAAGVALPESEFQLDMFGSQRGGGGESWTIGAEQWNGAPPDPDPEPEPPIVSMTRRPIFLLAR